MKEKYMREAIKQAKKAWDIGEVPIGCVIVYKDKIIGRGYNRRMVDKNTLSHAELNAIKKASKKLDDHRAVPDVCRSHSSGKNKKSIYRMHESKGRMCRLYYESVAGGQI